MSTFTGFFETNDDRSIFSVDDDVVPVLVGMDQKSRSVRTTALRVIQIDSSRKHS